MKFSSFAKATALPGVFALAACAMAEDGLLGTKADSVSALQNSSGAGGNLLQMIIAVVVVFALMKWLLPKMMGKFGGRLSTGVGSSIKIEESASFAGGTLYVVNVKDKSLLLGVTGTTITTLADLGTAVKNDPGPTFMEMVESTDGSKAIVTEFAVVEAPLAEEELPVNDAQSALDRLQRLMK